MYTYIYVATGLAGLFPKIKQISAFAYIKQVANKSTSIIFGLTYYVYYATIDKKACQMVKIY